MTKMNCSNSAAANLTAGAKKTNVHIVIGTRPEAIKTAPVYKALTTREELTTRLISTGQHQELLTQALAAFDLKPDFDLQVMRKGQSLSQLTSNLLLALENMFAKEKPDLVLAHGDTTTCYAAALSSFYHGIPFFHLEAGLRTFLLDSPFPEEFNRQCITKMSAHHFATSENAHKNLIADGVKPENITVTGNTLYDAISQMSASSRRVGTSKKLAEHDLAKYAKTVLMTLHRRAQGSVSLKPIMEALRMVAEQQPQSCFIFPVHPSPAVSNLACEVFDAIPNVILCPPIEYPEFLRLMSESTLILTDSGGVQEEAAFLGKNVLVLRDASERCDGIGNGTTQVIGSDPSFVFKRTCELLANAESKPSFKHPPMDRSPSSIIADVIARRNSA